VHGRRRSSIPTAGAPACSGPFILGGVTVLLMFSTTGLRLALGKRFSGSTSWSHSQQSVGSAPGAQPSGTKGTTSSLRFATTLRVVTH
jgi:hypothetical protein